MAVTTTETCEICGAEAQLVTERDTYSVGQRQVKIDRELVRCPECEEEYVTPEQMDANQRRASEVIREREGLLQPDEIRYIRTEVLDLTQREFETLLKAGPKTVTRWENGTVFQNGATDRLIRLYGRYPEIAAEVGREEGVDVRVPDGSPALPADERGKKIFEVKDFTFEGATPGARRSGPSEERMSWSVQGVPREDDE